jgi:hypothetical protein
MSVKIELTVFWVVMPCSVVVGYHLSEDHAASTFNPEDGDSMVFHDFNFHKYLKIISNCKIVCYKQYFCYCVIIDLK